MKLCPKCQKQFSDDANFCPVDAARLAPLETQSPASDPLAAKFELGERLGGSRTGAVHAAVDKATGQAVAVKLIAPAVVALPAVAQRLERELKQLERVQSGGVARILGSGKRGDDSWVAMELLDDVQTLGEAVGARGAMPVDKAAKLIEIIGEALIEAAQVGVVHRDLAPKNIVFAGDDVKLINFSLPVPSGDKVPGVAEFVAPEQHDGKPVDQRSNLYSLGAMYYFVLTAQPVRADDNGLIKPPSTIAEVPDPVDSLILRALDRSPTRRYLTVRQFLDEIGRVARGEATTVRATQPLGRAGKLRAEVVDTLVDSGEPSPGQAPIAGTILGVGAAAAAAERSPWAPPAAGQPLPATQPMPTTTEPGVAAAAPAVAAPAVAAAAAAATPVVAPPIGAAPIAAPAMTAPVGSGGPAVPAAPVIPAAPAVPAAPVVRSSPMLGTKKGRSTDAKGRFRETMWFKKGELDAQAAEAAAAEHARTGKIVTDKSDLLPIDERYKDDGSLSRTDKELYSLRTGATVSTAAVSEPAPGASIKVSEDALIGEMKGGRNRIFAIIAVAVVALVLLIVLLAR
jgi:eukaryotic-like serine/threonine-protein kinase